MGILISYESKVRSKRDKAEQESFGKLLLGPFRFVHFLVGFRIFMWNELKNFSRACTAFFAVVPNPNLGPLVVSVVMLLRLTGRYRNQSDSISCYGCVSAGSSPHLNLCVCTSSRFHLI